MVSGPLAAGLLRGADWFNDALLVELVAAGWPKLTRNQAQVFPLLPEQGVSQAELARRLGITRQSVHTIVRELSEFGILEQRGDDTDGRRTLVVLTTRGNRLAADAGRILSVLEVALAERIGTEAVDAIRDAVGCDWGTAPTMSTSHDTSSG